MIKAVIFDLGNVLVSFDHRIAARKVSALSALTEEEIFRFFFDSPLTAMFEEGKIQPQDFFSEVKKSLKLEIGYEEFLPVWNEIFFLNDTNRAVYEIAGKLKKNYRIAILSNINALHFDYLDGNFQIFGLFHRVFLSFEMKSKKPAAEIYKNALAELAVAPQEAFYTDDRPELVESARQLGIRGFVFKGIEQLQDDLASVGIKI